MILAITAVTGDNFVIFVRPLKVPLGNGVVLHRAWFSVIVSVLWVSMSVLSIALTSCIANRVFCQSLRDGLVDLDPCGIRHHGSYGLSAMAVPARD